MEMMLHPPRLQLRRGPRHRVEVGSLESEAGAVSGQGWSVVYDVTRAQGARQEALVLCSPRNWSNERLFAKRKKESTREDLLVVVM